MQKIKWYYLYWIWRAAGAFYYPIFSLRLYLLMRCSNSMGTKSFEKKYDRYRMIKDYAWMALHGMQYDLARGLSENTAW